MNKWFGILWNFINNDENLLIGLDFLVRFLCEMNTKEMSNFPHAESTVTVFDL